MNARTPILTAYLPPPEIAGPDDLARLKREIAVMEDAIAIYDRHAALKAATEARGIAIVVLPQTKSEIVKRVAERHRLTLEDLRGPRSSRHYAWPRQEAMWELRQHRNRHDVQVWSLPQIGEFLFRDHTTVLFGLRSHKRRTVGGAIWVALGGDVDDPQFKAMLPWKRAR